MEEMKQEDMSHEMKTQRRMQLVYARKTQERRIFMEDLFNYRKRKDKLLMKEIRDSMGSRWYQALSVPQTTALDTLEFCIYQDMLEARPIRTQRIMNVLGIIPRPMVDDLMHCVYRGREDPKEMLAELFLIKYQHPFNLRRTKYDLNARLLLSAIFYLGKPQLLEKLKEVFTTDQPEPPPKPKKKRKPRPHLASPYLEKMEAVLYEPRQYVRKPPPPLPNLDVLNDPLEDTPPVPKPPPPPPPPPPPKKRLARGLCDKVAGINPVMPYNSVTNIAKRTIAAKSVLKKVRRSKYVTEEKKKYGIGNTRSTVKNRRRKPKVPSTGLWNAQYTICGVINVRGKPVFILGNVTMLPVAGNIIHGGHAVVDGVNINIHCGIRGQAPPPRPDRCNCLKEWTEPVMQYLKKSKCYCGHYYDYFNEGVFPPDELPFFEKPTRYGPLQFRYDNIYDIDPKRIHVGKEFKRVWETDSVLHVEDPNMKKAQKKKKRSSKTCLGEKPKPENYLRCALHRMRHFNIAARLPDVHLLPELVAWMRIRLFGPYTKKEKKLMAIKSNWYWTMFTRFANHNIPHVPVPKIAEFNETTTWIYKQRLNDRFRKFTNQYKLQMFRAHADFANMMWPSMFQAQMPDKKFREIYYSYLFHSVGDVTMMHPYNSIETDFQIARCVKRPYRCPPKGVENLDSIMN